MIGFRKMKGQIPVTQCSIERGRALGRGDPVAPSALPAQTLEQGFNSRPDAAKLLFVGGGKFFERALSARSQREINLPAVNTIMLPDNEPVRDEPVHQAHRAVVPNLQALCESPDRNAVGFPKTLDREQSLMLLGGKPGTVRRFFAEVQKLPQRVAQVRQRLVFRLSDFHSFHHSPSILAIR